MTIELFEILGAAAGGFIGATFGALIAFIFTGFAALAGIAILLATGDGAFINTVAWGPVFGPHVAFAGGVAAAAYAGRRGWIDSGRDILTPLVSIGKPSVLGIGALFGVIGLLLTKGIQQIPWFGTHTDSIALSIVIAALVARLVFGKTGIIGKNAEGLTGLARFKPNDTQAWLPWQSKWSAVSILGLGVGLLSAWATVALMVAVPEFGWAGMFLGFAIGSISLLFLQLGAAVPVTHHIALTAGTAAFVFFPIVGDPVWAVVIGAVFGLIAGCVGEVMSRFWLIRGDSHIDPTASTIWLLVTVVHLIAIPFLA